MCPQCGSETDSVHNYREQLVKDLPLGRNTLLHLRKRRYRCEKCHKRFYEQNNFLPRYATFDQVSVFRKCKEGLIASRFDVNEHPTGVAVF